MAVKFRDEIVVYCGPMYSGKSFSMIFQLEKLRHARIPFIVFKPNMDRFETTITSRYANASEQAIPIDIKNPRSMLAHIDIEKLELPFTVAIDEAQFFSHEIIEVVKTLQRKHIQVLIAGLDIDGWGDPFGPMPQLLALATRVVKSVAACVQCNEEATRVCSTAPKIDGSNVVAGGGKETQFLPVCSKCFYKMSDEIHKNNS